MIWTIPAHAHNAFTGSNPKDGARLTEAPRTVTLSFLAALDVGTTQVLVTGPGGVPATEGKPDVRRNKVSVGVRPGAAGEYTVAYRVVSVDGHPVKGTIRFTVSTGTSPAPGAVPATTPSTGVAAPPTASSTGGAGAPPAVKPAAEQSAAADWWPWLLGAVVLLLAAAAGTYLVRRRAAGHP